ncbi:MAG: response regulator [Nitrospinota bacterium]|nr:response regulator [Nitrospinota bacterium]
MDSNISILLVEDDSVDIKTVKRAFKEANVTNHLDVAGNGEEALSFLRNNKNAAAQNGKRPGLIFLDLNMPVMGGIEFLKIMKNDPELKRIPVIVLTTSKEETERVDSFNLGVAGYIIKPVDFYKFVEAVRVINLYWTLSELPS